MLGLLEKHVHKSAYAAILKSDKGLIINFIQKAINSKNKIFTMDKTEVFIKIKILRLSN